MANSRNITRRAAVLGALASTAALSVAIVPALAEPAQSELLRLNEILDREVAAYVAAAEAAGPLWREWHKAGHPEGAHAEMRAAMRAWNKATRRTNTVAALIDRHVPVSLQEHAVKLKAAYWDTEATHDNLGEHFLSLSVQRPIWLSLSELAGTPEVGLR